jgi:hypothetical protein
MLPATSLKQRKDVEHAFEQTSVSFALEHAFASLPGH